MQTIALQLCPFSPFLEAELQKRFQVYRWFELEDQEVWLGAHAPAVRAVVTGGHIGISNSLVHQLPSLGIVAINGVGFDKVDLNLARERGIRVTYTPDVLTEDVADLALGLVIALLRGIPAADQRVRRGSWASGDFPLARRVSGCHFGIVGLGRIGQAIATRLAAFGPVSYTDLSERPVPFQFVPTALELARACDVLVLAMSANSSTRNIINREILDALGPDGYLVNVARGSLVDEPELIASLAARRIAGAALDVFADEPNVPELLRTSPNVVVTPHIASATRETRENMARLVLQSLDAFSAGAPVPSLLV